MTRMMLSTASLAVALAASALNAQEVTGDWLGTLSNNGGELHLALHISKAADGTLKGTLDSMDQAPTAYPSGRSRWWIRS